jgi:hypothetical protein
MILAVLLPKTSYGSISVLETDTLSPIVFDSVDGTIPLLPMDIHSLREEIERKELELIELYKIQTLRDTIEQRRMDRSRNAKRQQRAYQKTIDELMNNDTYYTNIYEEYRATMQLKEENCQITIEAHQDYIQKLNRRNWWSRTLAVIAAIGGAVIAVAF